VPNAHVADQAARAIEGENVAHQALFLALKQMPAFAGHNSGSILFMRQNMSRLAAMRIPFVEQNQQRLTIPAHDAAAD
jgi:hypothetical protein